MRTTTILMLLGLLAGSAHAQDEVYRYTDNKGIVHYTDKQPSKDAKPVNLPKLQTYPSGHVPKTFDPSTKAAAPKFTIAFDSPSPEETYRDAGATVNASVSIMPGLVGGFGLLYTVDGKPLNDAPSFTTSISVPGLERGSHVIGASLVDAKRQSLAQASVTIHIKPPTVKH